MYVSIKFVALINIYEWESWF